MAIAFSWWLRPDRSTSGLAALFGGLPLGAFVDDFQGPTAAPRTVVAAIAAATP